MERKNSSVFLMVVGVVFVIMAGGIFVTTTWNYLPEWGKDILLLLTSLGLFAGSVKAEKCGNLDKTEKVLFYLGTAFTGFFTISVMNHLDGVIESSLASCLAAASMVMLIPSVIKFLVDRNAFELNTSIAFENAALLFSCVAVDANPKAYILLFGGNVLALAIADYFATTRMLRNENVKLSIRVWYIIQFVQFAGLTFFTGCSNEVEMLSIITALICVVVTGLTYYAEETTVFRVLNSLSVMWFVSMLVSNSIEIAELDVSFGAAVVLIFAINFILSVVLFRKEMIYTELAVGLAAPVIQVFGYGVSSMVGGFFGGTDANWSEPYYPYSFLMAVGILALMFRKRAVEGLYEKEERNYLIAAALQTVVGIHVFMASKIPNMQMMAFWLIGCVGFVTLSLFLKNKTAKAVIRTLALVPGYFAGLSQNYFEISSQFSVEWMSFLAGIIIVLLGIIWYDRKEGAKTTQFVLTCLVLAFLLVNNLANPYCEIANVLILGIIGLVILVTAVIKESKRYAIASTVVLVLMALYITRAFWLSIAWWVYLFVAGVALIVFAIKKEREA